MTTCSSVLAWEIPRTEEAGELQSMGSRRVGHYSEHSARAHTHTHTWITFTTQCNVSAM